jgi:hypothetical protein
MYTNRKDNTNTCVRVAKCERGTLDILFYCYNEYQEGYLFVFNEFRDFFNGVRFLEG